MRPVAALLLLLLLLASSVGAQPPVPFVIAAEDDWAPYSSGGSASKPPVGFAVDLVRAAFATQGVTVEIISVPFARCMAYAANGKAAGCFNATITAENRERFYWHEPAMFEEELAIFARADAVGKPVGMADLRGHRVGYTNGYTYPSEFLHDPAIQKQVATSDEKLLKMLIVGRVDFILLNRMPGAWRIKQNPAFAGKARRVGMLSQDGFWVAFSRMHPEGERLAKVFGKGLVEMRRTGDYQRRLAAFRKRFN